MLKLLFLAACMFCTFLGGSSRNAEPVLTIENPMQISLVLSESEEFLQYYKEEFRKDNSGKIINICDITYASFREMYAKYIALNDEDRKVVDSNLDYEEGYTIKNSIDTLLDRFSEAQKSSSNSKRTLDQSSSIIVIVVIAVFGMSTICVFFVLKNGNIIQ